MASSSTKSSKKSSAVNVRAKKKNSPELVGPLWSGRPADVRAISESFLSAHTVEVAKNLLGLCLKITDPGHHSRDRVVRIVETEAYRAGDPASHSARGDTPRSRIMFGAPGRAYVYFIYGAHAMLNLVTEVEGAPGAVLIRGVEPVEGFKSPLQAVRTLNGPGKLTRSLGITLADNGEPVVGGVSHFQSPNSVSVPRFALLDDGWRPERILASPRVGIRVATEQFWRFFIPESPGVSRVPQNRQAFPERLKGKKSG